MPLFSSSKDHTKTKDETPEMMIPSRHYGDDMFYSTDERNCCEEEIHTTNRSIFKRKNKGCGQIIRCQETKQDQELIDHSEKLVDLCFVVDNTSSMSSEIDVAKETIQTIITTLHKHYQSDIRFSAISYRDHTDDYAVKEYPFTTNVDTAKQFISEMAAVGGGDYPEALASALLVLSKKEFNKKGRKIVVWIADAPPHGMNASGDEYPEGDKDENGNKIDWIKLGDYMKEKNVVFYTIICERSKDDQQLSLFMDYLATKTDGKCLLLTQANKVPSIIINGCVEDDSMDKLIEEKIKELGEERVKQMKEEDIVNEIHKLSESRKVAQVQAYEVKSKNTEELLKCSDLSSVDTKLFVTNTNRLEMDVKTTGDDFEYGEMNCESVSHAKVKKAFYRNARKK